MHFQYKYCFIQFLLHLCRWRQTDFKASTRTKTLKWYLANVIFDHFCNCHPFEATWHGNQPKPGNTEEQSSWLLLFCFSIKLLYEMCENTKFGPLSKRRHLLYDHISEERHRNTFMFWFWATHFMNNGEINTAHVSYAAEHYLNHFGGLSKIIVDHIKYIYFQSRISYRQSKQI